MPDRELGDFLRARRAAVDPSDFDLASDGRRVPGLRREELSSLAGVNVDYYARLEQGRERRPSAQVLDALARALRLDPDACEHLRRLAEPAAGMPTRTSDGVDPGLAALVDGWPMNPALVLSGALDILVANPLAHVLHRGFADADNLVLMVFDDPAGRDFYVDWEDVADDTVANLRIGWGHTASRQRAEDLAETLNASSDAFAARWARNEVSTKTHATKRLHHPDVGELTLRFDTFRVEGSDDQFLLVYRAEVGTAAEVGLRMLGSLASTADV